MSNGTQFKIEKSIPAPTSGAGRKLRYPWKTMEIGDSILVPCQPGKEFATQRNVIGSFTRFRPKAFTSSKVEGGIRVWRTA